VAFPNLAHRAAANVLRAAPTPQAAARLTPRRVITLLKQAGRRNDAGLAEKISSTLRAEARRCPEVNNLFHSGYLAWLGDGLSPAARNAMAAPYWVSFTSAPDRHLDHTAPLLRQFQDPSPIPAART
jgi:hypothetical protein